MSEAPFMGRGRNPDVLTCIANLSNDEVFTPPHLAIEMLDAVAASWADTNGGANIWSNKDVRFLDPATKSGVFLREITKRLVDGLAESIPSLQERVDHILAHQVFGIGITELTALLARRSVYCSKWANGPHSITRALAKPAGNIWFERTEHDWAEGRCRCCGAGRSVLDRGEDFESHAYQFIHNDNISARLLELFGADMQFDVIIGNPPYQLADGGQGASALPIYNKFVDQAKALEPRLLTMVIPSRWFFGGRGLDSFRASMLSDGRVRKLVDYPDSRQVFEGVDVAGGVCYFVWDRDNVGDCEVINHDFAGRRSSTVRALLEEGSDIFVRDNAALEIVRQVVQVEVGKPGLALPRERRFDRQVSGQKPFGLRTFFRGTDERQGEDDVLVLQSRGRAWASRSVVEDGLELIDKWKTFTSKSSSEHAGQADKNGTRRVLSLSGVLPPNSVVTETYVLLGTFETEAEAQNCYSYARTKFFRFLVATRSSAQDLARAAYSFVPVQDYSRPWTDSDLYEKYKLSESQIELIEARIRPMDAADAQAS